MSREEILQAKDRSIAHLRSILGDDAETIIAERRYGFISGLLKDVLKKPPIERITLSDNIDKVVINRWLGIPLFLALMYGMFQFVFTLSVPFMDWIDQFFGWLAGYASGVSPDCCLPLTEAGGGKHRGNEAANLTNHAPSTGILYSPGQAAQEPDQHYDAKDNGSRLL